MSFHREVSVRARPYLVFFIGPALAYLAVLLLVAAFVGKPSTLGWIGFGVVAAIGVVVAGAAALLYSRSRTNAPRLHPRLDGPLRLLVVADTHCDGASLGESVQRELAGRPSEVLVVAPMLPSPLHFLTDAEEGEREDARVRLTQALQGLAAVGVEARGTLGSDDPLQAIGDALAGFPAGEILLVAPREGRRGWLEHDLARKVRDAYGVHVTTVTQPALRPPSPPSRAVRSPRRGSVRSLPRGGRRRSR